MYAVLRLNSFDPAKLAASRGELEEFDRVHAAQPGYVGSVVGCGGAQPPVDRAADTIRNVATSTKVGEERVHIGRTCVHEAPSLGDEPVADVGDLDGGVGNLRPVGFA